MTDDLIALARRAVACRGWRFAEGMRGFVPGGQYARVVLADPEAVDGWYVEGLAADEEAPGVWPEEEDEVLPDLDDPATLGCLLGLVREAWGDQELSAVATHGGYDEDEWSCFVGQGCDFTGGTEAEALVVALENAP